MMEQIFQMSQSDKHTIEKVITDENVHFYQMIFGKNEGLHDHTLELIVVKALAPDKVA